MFKSIVKFALTALIVVFMMAVCAMIEHPNIIAAAVGVGCIVGANYLCGILLALKKQKQRIKVRK